MTTKRHNVVQKVWAVVVFLVILSMIAFTLAPLIGGGFGFWARCNFWGIYFSVNQL